MIIYTDSSCEKATTLYLRFGLWVSMIENGVSMIENGVPMIKNVISMIENAVRRIENGVSMIVKWSIYD